MKLFDKKTSRRLRGSTTAFFAFGMIPMVGIMALGFEIGNVAVQYRRLQNYVDSKAVAALKEEFGSLAQDVEFFRFVDGATAGGVVDAVPEKGHWDFDTFNNASPFVATNSLSLASGSVPAYRVAVESFDAPLLFGPLFNVASVVIRAEAVAFAPRREIVLVQDVSGSMCLPGGSPPCSSGGRIGPAKTADTQLITQMASQGIPGDRMGIVAFNDGVEDTQPLTPITSTNSLVNFVNDLEGTGGTDVGAGINAGNDLFSSTTPDVEIARIMIIVGDGPGGSGAEAAADAAEALGADVHTIAFCDGGDCSAATSFLVGLTRGNGTFSQAPSGPALTQLLNDIVTGVPMKLVQ
ncbi:MAG: VWA domain-containing protein [Myxococcota bacterium]